MKLLVTGAAGFIGSNFILYLLKYHPGDEIIVADALTYAGNPETLRMLGGSFKFCRADITDMSAMSELFKKEQFDAVVNFAAETHVDRSIEQPDVFLQTNIFGTYTLLEACRRNGVKRFHQISTDEVYGDLPLDRPDLSFDESYPIRTSSPYSASKASADLLVLSYFRTYGLPVTITRCSNNFGPFQFPEKLIPLTVIKALRGEQIPVYGSGENKRDWIYVEDHCAAVDLVLRKGTPGEVYNVGSGCEISNLNVVKLILSKTGRTEDLISFVPDRPGHDLRYSINARKLQQELGFYPKTEFEDGLNKTIAWYRRNSRWWENILSGGYRQAIPPMPPGGTLPD